MRKELSDLKKSQLISALYETVLHPEKYDQLMKTWHDCLEPVFSNPTGNPNNELNHLLKSDASLNNHFNRVILMLEQALWTKNTEEKPNNKADQTASISISQHPHNISMNDEALALFEQKLSFNELLDYIDSDGINRLKKTLAQLLDTKTHQHQTFLTLTTPNEQTVHFSVKKITTDNKQTSLQLKSLDISWSERLSFDLSEAYKLTPTEIMVTKQMAAGHGLAKIADKLDRSISTIRTHIKSIFRKTNSTTQVDLIRLISLMSQVIGSNITQASIPSKINQLALPDGRKMKIYSYGPSDGTTVIFIHNMLNGVDIISRIEKQLFKMGIRMICPIRAGFELSAAYNSTKDALNIFAADLAYMHQELDIKNPILMGYKSGAVYAFAAAKHSPNLYSAIVNVSGAVPIIHKSQLDNMTVRQRVFAYTACYIPSLLPILLRGAINELSGPNAIKFLEAIHLNNKHDWQVIKKLNLQKTLLNGYKSTAQQSQRGFATDTYHVAKNWSNLANNNPVPTHLIHGTHDPVVSIKSVINFSNTHPSIQLHEVKDAGQLLFYQNPKHILSHIQNITQ